MAGRHPESHGRLGGGGIRERERETESEREEEEREGGHEDRSLTLFCQLTPADLSGCYMWGV